MKTTHQKRAEWQHNRGAPSAPPFDWRVLPMRSVEEVLRIVADSEYYAEDSKSRGYMCFSLEDAMKKGLISIVEVRLAGKEIKRYLRDLGWDDEGSLSSALYKNSLPNDFLSRKAIYLDWNNRPKPWKEGGV